MATKTINRNGIATVCCVNRYLLEILKEHDCATFAHSRRVANISLYLGRLIKLSEIEVNQLVITALLHDIGKIELPHDLLCKTGRLDTTEWEEIKKHCEYGAIVIANSRRTISREIIESVFYHHEFFNGNGYKGIKGESIPIYARVIAIADAFDAMTNPRPYRSTPLSYDEALSEIQIHSGTQFDPYIVDKIFMQENLKIKEERKLCLKLD